MKNEGRSVWLKAILVLIYVIGSAAVAALDSYILLNNDGEFNIAFVLFSVVFVDLIAIALVLNCASGTIDWYDNKQTKK